MPARNVRFVLPVLLSGALTLSACGPQEPTTTSGDPTTVTVRQPDTHTLLLDAADPAELALAASRQVFDRSPVAVLAAPAADDVTVRATHAAAAESLGAPALLVGDTVSADGIADELRRLGVRVAVVVEPEDPAGHLPQPSGSPTPTTDDTAPAREAATLAGADVLTFEAERPLTPDDDAPSGLAPDDATDLQADVAAVLAPAQGPGPAAASLDEVLALTDPRAPGQEAAVATLRAAGAVDVPVPGGRIAASPRAIEEIDGAQALAVVGVGSTFGPAEDFAWRVAAAESGTLLPAGGQDLLPARYVTTGVDWWDEPGDAVARAQAAAVEHPTSEETPVVPTLVVRVGESSGDATVDAERAAALDALVTQARQDDLYVLLDLPSVPGAPVDTARPWEGLLTVGGVGVAVRPEARPSDGTTVPGQVDAAEIEALVTYIEGVVTNGALPPALVVVHQTRPDSVVDRSSLAEAAAGTDAVEVVLVADRTGADVTTGWVWDQVTYDAPAGVHLGWSGPTVPGTFDPALVPTDPAPVLVAAS